MSNQSAFQTQCAGSQSVNQARQHKKCIGLPSHACGAFKVKSRACVTRVVQRSCQAREHEKYISPPRFVSCCNSLTVTYMDLVLGVYSKNLLQNSCSHQWPLGKFPHRQLCCRHLRPSPYNDSHCFAAPVPYDTRLSSSSTCSKYKSPAERGTAVSDIYPGVCTLHPGHPVSKSQLLSKPSKTPENLCFLWNHAQKYSKIK